MRITYDLDADALSVELRADGRSARTVVVTKDVRVDLDEDGGPVALEVLRATAYYTPEELGDLLSASSHLTLTEAAVESGGEITASTLRVQVNKGRIPATKRGRDWLVTRADLYTYLENRDPRGRRSTAAERGAKRMASAEPRREKAVERGARRRGAARSRG